MTEVDLSALSDEEICALAILVVGLKTGINYGKFDTLKEAFEHLVIPIWEAELGKEQRKRGILEKWRGDSIKALELLKKSLTAALTNEGETVVH